MKSLRGKRALVTGAAGGIGRAIALRLAEEGADVALVDIDQDGLSSVAQQIEHLGREALPLVCDVRQPEQVAAAVHELLDRWGAVELLVSNAGVVHYGPTEAMTAEQWDRVLETNLLGPVHFLRLLLPTLLAQPEAHLVTIASMYGLFATRKAAAYHATKYAMVGLTESLRAEYGRLGIGVTLVCPGFVTTNLFAAGTSSSGDEQPVPNPPAWLCTTPERVAARTIRGIYRNQRLVLVTPLAYLMYYLRRLAPWILDWVQHLGRAKGTNHRLSSLAERRGQRTEVRERRKPVSHL